MGKRRLHVAYYVLAAFVILLFVTQASFLYPFHLWDDVNSYFSVGKGLMHGRLPYRDLFDQKGAVLYFLYGIAYLISRRGFLGVFLLEWVACTADLLLIDATARLFRAGRFSYAVSPLALALVFSSRAFYWGGSAEELLLPFLFAGVFLLTGDLLREDGTPMRKKEVFLAGLCAGAVLHIKFNSLGFYIAWMAVIFFRTLFPGSAVARTGRTGEDGAPRGTDPDGRTTFARRLSTGLLLCVVFLGGMAAFSLPVFAFFWIRGALRDYLHVYFYLNLFVYSEQLPLLKRLYVLAKTVYQKAIENLPLLLPVVTGAVFVLAQTDWRKGLRTKEDRASSGQARDVAGQERATEGSARFPVVLLIAYAALLAGLLTGIFIGGVMLPYYFLPAGCFAGVGAGAAGCLSLRLSRRLTKEKRRRLEDAAALSEEARGAKGTHGDGRVVAVTAALSLLLSAGICFSVAQSPAFLPYRAPEVLSPEQLWVFRFRDRILQSGRENPTLLNVGGFDAGLYTATGIVPTCRFFQTQTIRLNEVGEEQGRFLREGLTDYVLVVDYTPDGLHHHYEWVDSVEIDLPALHHRYDLYERVR